MVKQYPDHIVVKVQAEPYQDDNNNWVQPEAVNFESDCRGEPNRSNAVIKTGDGAEKYYDYNVYMPKTTTELPVGSDIVLTLHDGLVVKGMVKRAHNGQLNSRVWV